MNLVERVTNPLTQARRSAMFWRTAFWLIVPPMFVALCALTHFTHQEQGRIRHQVSVALTP